MRYLRQNWFNDWQKYYKTFALWHVNYKICFTESVKCPVVAHLSQCHVVIYLSIFSLKFVHRAMGDNKKKKKK